MLFLRSWLLSFLLLLGVLGVVRGQRSPISVRVLSSSSSGIRLALERTYAASDTLSADLLSLVGGRPFTFYPLDLPSLAIPVWTVEEADAEVFLLPDSLKNREAWLSVIPIDTVVQVTQVGMERKRPRGTLEVAWLTRTSDGRHLRRYRRLVVQVRYGQGGTLPRAKRSDNPHLQVTRSVLAEGTWFKLSVRKAGLYVIDRALIAGLGLNPDAIDPDHIRIYGNGGKPLPALNAAPRPADLVENAVKVVGGGDGRFDEGDYVLFWAEGTYGWERDDRGQWRHYLNPFSFVNTYFMRVDAPGGKRVHTLPFPTGVETQVLQTVEARYFLERELENIGQDGAGSGLDWLGPRMDVTIPQIVAIDTLFPGFAGGEVHIRSRIAVRANPAATVQFQVQGENVHAVTPPPVSLTGTGAQLGYSAYPVETEFTVQLPTGSPFRLSLQLQGRINDPQAWLDWVEVSYPRKLQAVSDFLAWETPLDQTGWFESVLTGFSRPPEVWDITDPANVRALSVVADGATYRVRVEVTDERIPRRLVAFAPGTWKALEEGSPVANQNLHGERVFPELVIVTPGAFRAEAERLAAYRRDQGLRVQVVEVEKIYNEFSGGVPDMRAVRDYFKFLYDLAENDEQMLRYALLFGDGHYDYRNITGTTTPNWIFPYETEETLYRIRSYTSDDYFGLLDDNEGLWPFPGDAAVSAERVDIGIGRLTVLTQEEARTVVDKIMHYESPATQGDWRTRYTFVADDGPAGSRDDDDLHTQNADVVAELVGRRYPELVIQKVYGVAYPAVTTATGRRIPGAHDDLIRAIREGTLIWNYSGHGNAEALADERIFTIEDIAELDNYDRLSVFITATCSFGRWDMAERQSGAEELLVYDRGGAVALLTTVRLVFTSASTTAYNVGLNLALNEFLLEREPSGLPLRLGDVFRLTKNTSRGAQGNSRKFNLLGDPTMRLGLPVRSVSVDSLNGIPLKEVAAPLRALEQVELTGHIRDARGMLDPTFSGEAYVSIFDAPRQIAIPQEDVRYTSGYFKVQNELIWKGRVRVQQGRFRARFIVPRDISYSNRAGKILAYVRSANEDGVGATRSVVIGGTASAPIVDTEGPRIRLYLNDTTFVSGGPAPEEPLLLVKLYDETGINTVGTGVGHELLLVIDDREEEAINLSTYFQGALDSYQQGEVRYQLPRLEEGFHRLKVKAWDVMNNSGTAELEFYVVPEEELRVEQVMNYPNPTPGSTWFVFQHNQPPGTPARVRVRIYTLQGWPVRTLREEETLPEGVLNHSTVRIFWDGRDEDGEPLATGVYLYKVFVQVESLSGERKTAEKIEKLVIIR